jgi:esterase/lipase superfamily enzyme
MALIETLERIVADRLRVDAAGAWVDAQPAWLDRKLGAFYSSTQQATTAILHIGRQLSHQLSGVSELSITQASSLANLDQPIRVLISEIAVRVVTERHRERQGPAFRGPASLDDDRRAVSNVVNEGAYTCLRIFYGTDRREHADAVSGIAYSHERSEGGVLNFGECLVTVPRGHKVGVLESPSILRFEFKADPTRHIVLHSVLKQSEHEFLKRVAVAVADSPDREAFIFVHGYNVAFETCARRTAQIAFDLKFSGASIFYSWPSNARISDYTVDETNALWTVPHFDRFLTLIAQYSGAARLHVMAHSMGNRPVCDALRGIAARIADQGRPKLQELILAAPDIDTDTFRQMADALRSRAERITLYASSKDKALGLSCRIHGYSRAGIPILIVPGVDTVEASAVNTDFLAHSYFCEDRSVLSDIYHLIRAKTPPETRFDLTEVPTASGKYYVFRG